jgi:cyclophilin family peptidyl-prolyl cis-trans isomerase
MMADMNQYFTTQSLIFLFLICAVTACVPSGLGGPGDDDDSVGARPGEALLEFHTTLGSFDVEMLPQAAPITSANFLAYVDEGFYDGADGLGATVFHRVIAGFMIQGGGQTAAGAAKSTHSPIINESATSGLSNSRGTVAMARTDNPNSATAQFFINLVDNDFLDAAEGNDGYAVFAVVTDGMETVDEIAAVSTNSADEPTEPIVIEQVVRVD